MSPIRPENRALYPRDWPAISRRVRDEAGNVCEWCGIANGTVLPCDNRCDADENAGDPCRHRVDRMNSGRVVLTVAHLDHDPANCDRANLKALCQRCHNVYDAPRRAAGVRQRRDEATGQRSLLGRS